MFSGSDSFVLKNSYNVGIITSGTVANRTTTANLGSNVGGIVGELNSQGSITVSDLKNYGAIYGGWTTGGIFGQFNLDKRSASTASFTKLTNFGAISGDTAVGGIAGYAQNWGTSQIGDFSYLANSSTGVVTATNDSAGGLFGRMDVGYYIQAGRVINISQSYNDAAISAATNAGGLIGKATPNVQYDTANRGRATLTNVYNAGSVTSTANSSTSFAGGLIGNTEYTHFIISQAYNSGTVTSGYTTDANKVGGIAGLYWEHGTFTLSTSNIHMLTGKVANDLLFGHYAGGTPVTSTNIPTDWSAFTCTSVAPATFQNQSLATDGFSTTYWGGGSGVMPYLKGFTTPITITLGALSKTYGDANPTISYSDSYISSITWGSAITQYSNAGNYAYTTANMFTPTFTTGSASDYSITYATTNSLTINPYAVTLTGSKTYDGAATTAGATITVSNALNGDTVTVTNSGTAGIASKNVGSRALSNFTGLSLSNSNYTLTSASGAITVNARPITISTSNVTKTYDGDTTASATATAISGTSLGSGDSFSGGTFAFTDKNAGTGNKTVTVSGVTVNDGNSGANYTITLANNTTSTINKATLTVSGSKVYDGTNAMATYLTLGGFVGSETVGYSAATVNDYHVATANKYINAITLTDGTNGGLASNYQIGGSYGAGTNAITITAKMLTPTISNAGVTKVYDGDTTSALTPTYTFSGLVSGDTAATLTNTGIAYNDKDVADATTITVSGLAISGITGNKSSAATDYVLDATSKTVAATITQKSVTLSGVNIADKVYDGTTNITSVASSTFTGAVNGDDVNVDGTLSAFSSKNVGTYSISVTGLTLTGTHASNYVLSGTTATDNSVAITAKTVTLSASKVYDGTTSLDSYVSLGGFIGSETLIYTGATVNDKHVATAGKYIDAITLADGSNGGVASNYQLPALNNANAPVTITAKTLTPTLSNAGVTKVYDGSTSTAITPTYSVSGFVTNDTEATITHTAKAYDDKDVADATKITVSGLALSAITGTNGSAATDYVLSTSTLDKTATITTKTLTITGLAADNKIYDSTTDVTISNWGSVTTGVGTETLTLNHGTASFSDKNKADGKTVTAIGYALADGSNGGEANNYQLASTSSTTTANIIARPVTLSGSSGVTKVYDGLTSMPVGTAGYGSIVNGISGDDLYVSGAPVYNSSDVAAASTVLIGSVALAGADATNYSLSWTNGSGTISKAPLTVTANNDAKFVTQNDSLTNFAGVSYSGFVVGEGVGDITTTGLTVSRTNNTQNNAGSYSGVLVPSGLSADNYSFNYTNGDYTIVAADQLLVRVQNASTTYATNATYTIASAEYLNGSNQIVALNLTGVNSVTSFTLSDGVGGNASFTLGASNPILSTANLLKAGSYQVGATNIIETSNNFSNQLTVIGALSVNQKAVTVNAGGVSKVYDGTTGMNNLTLGLSGVENGDTVAISGNGNFVGKDVGINKTYTVGSLTLGLADSTNYYLSSGNSMSGNDGEITKKTVTLSATKTYDGNSDLTGFVIEPSEQNYFSSPVLKVERF